MGERDAQTPGEHAPSGPVPEAPAGPVGAPPLSVSFGVASAAVGTMPPGPS